MDNEKKLTMRLPAQLLDRLERQRKKEGRTQSDFIRRVLDRYLVEQEFRGGDVTAAAQASIEENRKLLDLLRNS
jgi:predicted DNA-binding protein